MGDVEVEIYWSGSLETCDLCHDEYPMCWIIFTGRQFLCYACYHEGDLNDINKSP